MHDGRAPWRTSTDVWLGPEAPSPPRYAHTRLLPSLREESAAAAALTPRSSASSTRASGTVAARRTGESRSGYAWPGGDSAVAAGSISQEADLLDDRNRLIGFYCFRYGREDLAQPAGAVSRHLIFHLHRLDDEDGFALSHFGPLLLL